MVFGVCNNRCLFFFDYYLEINDSVIFFCMVGGNGMCVDGFFEEIYIIWLGMIFLCLKYNCSNINFNLFVMNMDYYFVFKCRGIIFDCIVYVFLRRLFIYVLFLLII